ncbi:MAG TPA: sigma-70 family RNA polymerase sigma factor [Gemmataceae bacterium]|nr:sigma-70 family RNA polymerase sigma factor [Gemmataceae bacterium]
MTSPPFDTALRRWLYGLSGKPAANLPDGQLLQRFVQARDESAFALLVQRHGPLVLGVCRRLLQDSHDADDAFQATFLVLACQAAAIRRTEALSSFLHSTAYRIACRLRGQKARRQMAQQQAARQRPEAILPPEDDRETFALLHEELNSLPRKHRDVLILCYLQGKTNEEAARELGYPAGSMSRHLSRARELLRERLLARGVSVVLGAMLAEHAKASVSSALLCGTLETIRRYALASALLAGSTPPVAVVLAQGILRAAWISRLTLASVILAVGVVCAGGVAALQTPADKQLPAQAETPKTKRQVPQPRRDRYGDPLPNGVLAHMGTERLRHPYAVRVAFAGEGKTLISAGQDHTIRFWDCATGQLKRMQQVPPALTVAALSPDGKTLASMDLDKQHLVLWDVTANKERQRIRADNIHFHPYSDTMEFSPDGKSLAATDYRNSVFRLWDIDSGKERGRCHLEGSLNKLAFAPDGKRLAVGSGKGIVIWDVASSKELHTITREKATGRSLAFSPDGKLLASAGFLAFVLWDTATWKEEAVLQIKTQPPFQGGYEGVSFSPDGKTLAIYFDDYVALWDRSTRKEEKRLHGPHFGRSHPHTQLCFSPDGKQLAFLRPGAIVLWDVATDKQVQEQPGHFSEPDSLAFSPDGNFLASASGGDRTVRLWNARSGEQLHVWTMPHPLIGKLHFTPDGANVIAEGFWGECRMWDVQSGEQRQIFRFSPGDFDGSEMLPASHLSPDGKRLTAVSLRGEGKGKYRRYLTTWDVATGQGVERRALAFDSRILLGIETFSPNGKLVTTVDPRKAQSTMIYDVIADRPLRNVPRTGMGSLSFSPDSKLIAYGGNLGGTETRIQLMDASSGGNLLTVSADDGRLWTFTPDGRYLAAAGEKILRLWELATGKEVLNRRFAPMDSPSPLRNFGSVSCLAIAPDGRSIATGLRDTNLFVWDLAPATQQKYKLSSADLERIWNELAGDDAARAYRALGMLIADPERAVPFLRERLQPVKEDAPRIRQLIADLDSDQFSIRDAAYKELEKMDDAAHAVLRQALPQAASLELRRRVETLLSVPWIVRSPEKLRQIRAVTVLEQIGDAAARRVLERLAGGAAEARQTREAKAALQRLRTVSPKR